MLRFYRTIYRRGFQESPWRNQWWGIVLSRSGVEHPPNRMKYEMVGFPSLRTVGFRRNRYPGPAATAHAHGSVSDSRGHHAIFQEKIPVGADARPDPEVQRFGVLGSLLRTANPGCDGATSTANSICSQRPRH